MPAKKSTTSIVPLERIEGAIYLIRGEKVILDTDLAQLYKVPTKVLNQAVSRNLDRFPGDFMFRLSKEEFDVLRSQIVTSSWGGRRYAPRVFTEQGVAMLSTVLRSKRAVQVNIQIIRTFVRLRQMLASHEALARKLAAMERNYDKQFKVVFDALREMMRSPEKAKQPIGFQVKRPKRKK